MLQAYVSSVSEVRCKCVYADVAKVDRDVAYVASVSKTCCKRLFKMFYLLQTYVASIFYLDIAYISHIYVVRICSKCFSHFSLMLQ
jgi:hypothetical protein